MTQSTPPEDLSHRHPKAAAFFSAQQQSSCQVCSDIVITLLTTNPHDLA